MAEDLAVLGIDVDCLPLADVPVVGADPVVGDRAYGDNPAKVAAIAGAIAKGLGDGGVLSVLKHSPAMAAPQPTATSACRWWIPTGKPSKPPISRRSGHWRGFRSA